MQCSVNSSAPSLSSSLSPAGGQRDRYALAVDISLAALTGDGVFNFGEVLATPILQVLQQTPQAWLSQILRVSCHL